MKLTASHCCFVCQLTSYALTANEAETCQSALTGSASLVFAAAPNNHTHTLTQSTDASYGHVTWWHETDEIIKSHSSLNITVQYSR